MAKIYDITNGQMIRDTDRTGFGQLLDKIFDNLPGNSEPGRAWDSWSPKQRRSVLKVAGVVTAVAVGIPGVAMTMSAVDHAMHPKVGPTAPICLPEVTRTAKPGDTLSGLGEERLNELADTAAESGVSVVLTPGDVVDYTKANLSLNGLPEAGGISAGSSEKLGQVCVVAAVGGPKINTDLQR